MSFFRSSTRLTLSKDSNLDRAELKSRIETDEEFAREFAKKVLKYVDGTGTKNTDDKVYEAPTPPRGLFGYPWVKNKLNLVGRASGSGIENLSLRVHIENTRLGIYLPEGVLEAETGKDYLQVNAWGQKAFVDHFYDLLRERVTKR